MPKSAHYYLYFSRWQVQKRQILFLPKNLIERQVDTYLETVIETIRFARLRLKRQQRKRIDRVRVLDVLGVRHE